MNKPQVPSQRTLQLKRLLRLHFRFVLRPVDGGRELRRSGLAAALFSAALAAFAASLSIEAVATPVDDVIAGEWPASAAPGMAYAVVSDGRIVEIGERGVRHIGRQEMVRADTTFLIGSISKSFTALAVMQLVEQGSVEIDAPIARYVDAFAGKPAGQVTVRQLLSHTSGYSTIQGNNSQTDVATDEDSLRRRAAILADVIPPSSPGATWAYSNANYQILGYLIEVVSGLDYATYVEANILAPAGMDDSYVHGAQDRDSMATGHRPWFGSKLPLTTNRTGRGSEGGIVSSARDMARYLGIMINGRDDILSAAGKRLMMTSAGEVSPEYGFGWALNPEQGTVFHGGSNPGFEGVATMVPDEKKGVVVLSNSGSGFGFGENAALFQRLTETALDLPAADAGYSGWRKVIFVGLAAIPILFLAGMARAWTGRDRLRANTGVAAESGLWLALTLALALAWVLLVAVPGLYGTPFSALLVFRPDIGLLLALIAATAVVWALFQLVLAKTRPRPATAA